MTAEHGSPGSVVGQGRVARLGVNCPTHALAFAAFRTQFVDIDTLLSAHAHTLSPFSTQTCAPSSYQILHIIPMPTSNQSADASTSTDNFVAIFMPPRP